MYDISKIKEFHFCTVAELIAILKTCDQKAQIVCDGDDCFWVHFEQDGSVVNIDSNSLEDLYDEED